MIFDEFHERSLNADLGLALCLEVRGALRPDLKLLVMSATLDAGPVAALMGDAPVDHLRGPRLSGRDALAAAPAGCLAAAGGGGGGAVRQALEETEGGVLVFLPGEGEIRRVEGLLAGLPGVAVRPAVRRDGVCGAAGGAGAGARGARWCWRPRSPKPR